MARHVDLRPVAGRAGEGQVNRAMGSGVEFAAALRERFSVEAQRREPWDRRGGACVLHDVSLKRASGAPWKPNGVSRGTGAVNRAGCLAVPASSPAWGRSVTLVGWHASGLPTPRRRTLASGIHALWLARHWLRSAILASLATDAVSRGVGNPSLVTWRGAAVRGGAIAGLRGSPTA